MLSTPFMALQGLAAHLPRVEDRLLLTLWMLAERCGRVTPEGIVLPLALSHEALGRLAAASTHNHARATHA